MSAVHTHTNLKLTRRMRRLRRSEALRAMVRETRLSPDVFMLPLFVCDDEAVRDAEAAKADGVRSLLLFGLPDSKDDIGSLAYDPEAPVQSAVRAIKRAVPGMLIVTDVCLCEYTDHGHCGIVIDDDIAND